MKPTSLRRSCRVEGFDAFYAIDSELQLGVVIAGAGVWHMLDRRYTARRTDNDGPSAFDIKQSAHLEPYLLLSAITRRTSCTGLSPWADLLLMTLMLGLVGVGGYSADKYRSWFSGRLHALH